MTNGTTASQGYADLTDAQLHEIANDRGLRERDRQPARAEIERRRRSGLAKPVLLHAPTQPEPIAEPETVDPSPWPDPIDPAAYYGLAGDYVRLLEPETESDPVAILLQTLVMFGNLVGRGAWYTVEDTRHHVNEYALLVGDTAKGRKGTSEGRVRFLMRSIDEKWEQQRVMSGLSSGEGLIYNVRDPIVVTEKVKRPKAGEPSYQEVEIPGADSKELLVIESEYASILHVLARDTNTLSAVMRLAWDGKVLRTMTKNSPLAATGAHVSIIGHITRDELLSQVKEMGVGTGFANRMLFAAVRRSRYLPEGGGLIEVGEIVRRLRAAVAFARQAGEIRRNTQARAVWAYIYPELSDAAPGAFGAATSRGEAHVLRLSMLYALLDCTATVTAEHLLAALALWDYCRDSARWVFGSSIGETDADTLIAALREAPEGLDRSAIARVFAGHKPKGELDGILRRLASSGMATCERVKGAGAKPREVWRLNSANTQNTQFARLYDKARAYLDTFTTTNYTLSKMEEYLEGSEVPDLSHSENGVFSVFANLPTCQIEGCVDASGDGLGGYCPRHYVLSRTGANQ